LNRVSWLGSLPHQIPFRAASSAQQSGDDTIVGAFLCTANDSLPLQAMVVEAMAQLAGGLVLREQGFLTGIDRCEIDRYPLPGEVVEFSVTLEAGFGGTWRFSGTGRIGGVEVIRGRFYLASSQPHESS
jgi:hypothetical protein